MDRGESPQQFWKGREIVDVKRTSHAGTLESGDVFVEVAPSDGGVEVSVESVVLEQFGAELESAVRQTLEAHQVTGAKVSLKDRGALDCTVRARVETALKRAAEPEGGAAK